MELLSRSDEASEDLQLSYELLREIAHLGGKQPKDLQDQDFDDAIMFWSK